MTKSEMKILKRVILRQEKKRLRPYESTSYKSNEKFKRFQDAWKEPEDFSESLWYVIEQLPVKVKYVLVQKYVQGLSFLEIAAEMGVTVAAVQYYERCAFSTLSSSPNIEILLKGLKSYKNTGE